MEKRLQHYRQTLHQIPEIGFDLFKTSAFLRKELTAMGYAVYTYAKTGVVAYKKGKNETAIAFRSDMDALPLQEAAIKECVSLHPGKMHACGHDGHMAMLLGFAYFMHDKPLLNDSLVLLFQPAEEGPGGAKVMIEEGVLDAFKITKIFGMHLYPNLEQGMLGVVEGVMMTRNGELALTIHGQSAHGAEPHAGKDAIVAAAAFILQAQSIVARFINPLDSAVVTIGLVNGGEAANIIAKQVVLKGSIRAFDDGVYSKIVEALKNMAQGIESAYDVTIDLKVIDFYPVVKNDTHLYKQVVGGLDEKHYRPIPPLTFSEDFAFFQQKIPGLFVMLGSKNKEKGYVYPLHSHHFDFDEVVLLKGLNYYIHVAKTYQLIA